MLARIRKSMQERDQGFTLIELLVVMIIIGILAAIAIPVFLNQREQGWKSQLESDLRNAAVHAETYSVDHDSSYEGIAAEDINDDKIAAVTLDVAGTATGYCIVGTHARLTTPMYLTKVNTSGAVTVVEAADKPTGCP